MGQNDTLSGFLGQKTCFWGRFHSFILPSSVSLNEAVFLNVSSMTSCVPPEVLGLMFLMMTSPSFLPFIRALMSRFVFFTVG